MILLVEYYHSGYGRRRLPHCVTNNEGPEKFGICGRPVECTHDHRATKAAVQQIKKKVVFFSILWEKSFINQNWAMFGIFVTTELKCGLEFLYNGDLYEKCIKTETPSSKVELTCLSVNLSFFPGRTRSVKVCWNSLEKNPSGIQSMFFLRTRKH